MIVEFSRHKDSHARGRNGYFIPARASVCKYVWDSVPKVHIGVYSNRGGTRTPPIVLRLTLADAKRLQDAIGTAISEATA